MDNLIGIYLKEQRRLCLYMGAFLIFILKKKEVESNEAARAAATKTHR